jgi:GTP:adenosylcobinamide-phosphate guanylyltransferase
MSCAEHASPALTALILAASRSGVEDSVARLQNKSHKCLVETDGIPMLERVVQSLLDSQCFEQILVSIEGEHVLQELPVCCEWIKQGTIRLIPSSENLVDSVVGVADAVDNPFPLVITTADNVLHTPELIKDFVSSVQQGEAEVAVAVARESTVRAEYPEGKFGFFQFRDGGYSFCNLFAVNSSKGLDGAKIFRTGGQFRKKPWRILRIFGVLSLIKYKWRLADLDDFRSDLSRKLGISLQTVLMNYAYAPIDVDNPTTFAFSEKTLKARRLGTA